MADILPDIEGRLGLLHEATPVVIVDTTGNPVTIGGSSGGDASAANQTATQAAPGSDATKAIAVQGVTNGKAVTVTGTITVSNVTFNSAQSGAWNITNITGTVTLPTGAATSANQIATGTAAQTMQGNVAAGAVESGNPVKIGGLIATSVPSPGTPGNRVAAWFGANGQQIVTVGDASGFLATTIDGSADGQGASTRTLAVSGLNRLYNGTTWDRIKKPNNVSRIATSAATTNLTLAKTSGGNIHKITAYNTTASAKFIKVFNKTTAVTLGTDTPYLTLVIPPNARIDETYPNPLYMSAGISYAITGGAGDSDTTALAAGDVVGFNIMFD